MAYSDKVWKDSPDHTTPLSAAGLNDWEARIKAETDALSVLAANIAGVAAESYGAVGNGTTDDTTAIAAALATGKRVVLKRGSTYKVSSVLTMATAGQVLAGNGAKLKRANQSGSTEWFTVRITAADCRIQDLEFDGNKSHYSTAGWATTSEVCVETGCDRFVIERCYLHDFPGEGISIADSADTRVVNNTLVDGNGNGVHYGSGGSPGVRGARCINNRIENMNLNTGVGHADGCVVLSANIADLLVSGNRLKAALCGVGAIGATDNSDVTISGNEIHDMTRAAVDGANGTSGTASNNVLVAGNRIYDCAPLVVNQSLPGGGVLPKRWTITGNLLINTKISAQSADSLTITGNVMSGLGNSTYAIELTDCTNVAVRGNHVSGAQWGIVVGGSSTVNLLIADNMFVNQYSGCMTLYTAGMVNVLISGNSIVNSSASETAYLGVKSYNNTVRGNQLKLVKGKGIYVVGAYPIVKDNVVRLGTTSGIYVENTATNALVKNNETDGAVNDNGTSTTLSGNVIVV